MNQLLAQLRQWPPTSTTVMGGGLIVAAVDYLIRGNVGEATVLAGLFAAICPQDKPDVDRLKDVLSQIQPK